jgi:hypothetical protein
MTTRLWLPLVALAAACGTTTEFARTNPNFAGMASRPPGAVDVYTAAPPPRPFVEVGIIEARQSSEYSLDGMDAIIAELRNRAAHEGCDGVILTGDANSVVGSSFVTGSVTHGTGSLLGSGSVKTLKGYRGTCIVYADSAAQ